MRGAEVLNENDNTMNGSAEGTVAPRADFDKPQEAARDQQLAAAKVPKALALYWAETQHAVTTREREREHKHKAATLPRLTLMRKDAKLFRRQSQTFATRMRRREKARPARIDQPASAWCAIQAIAC